MRHEQRPFLIAAGGGGAAGSGLADQANGAGGALDLDRHLAAALRHLFGRLEIIHGRKGDETRGLEPRCLAVPTEVALELPDRLIHLGFKRSSQHLDGGGCDEGWETVLGLGTTSRVAAVARPTRRGAA